MKAYIKYRAIVSTHGMSIFPPRATVIAMYSSMTVAIPDTMAEKRKTIGMSGVDHQGFALIEPKMNPTYPCRRKEDGLPTIVRKVPSLWSIRSDSSEMLSTPSDIAW